MTTPGSVGCHPVIRFKLNIKDTVEPKKVECFNVTTESGQSLLQAMQEYQKRNQDFCFQTKDVPTSGPYVVEVRWNGNIGINGENTFWETLLYNEGKKEAKPISLCYKLCPNDNVFLRFGFF